MFFVDHLYTPGNQQGLLDYLCWGDQTMQIDGQLEEVSLVIVHCLSWCPIMTPRSTPVFKVTFCNPVST